MKFPIIIRTRTLVHDYRMIAFPNSLRYSGSGELEKHVQYIMYEEGRETIKGFRYHVMRHGSNIIFGIATRNFGKKDEFGRVIRGYYGIVMPLQNAAVPKPEVFERLHKTIVEPCFAAARVSAPIDSSIELLRDDFYQNVDTSSLDIKFNVDNDKVLFLPSSKIDNIIPLLQYGIDAAKSTIKFEFVCGFNSKPDALKLPFMNVVCYDQPYLEILPYAKPSALDNHFWRNSEHGSRNLTSESPRSNISIEDNISNDEKYEVWEIKILKRFSKYLQRIINTFVKRFGFGAMFITKKENIYQDNHPHAAQACDKIANETVEQHTSVEPWSYGIKKLSDNSK